MIRRILIALTLLMSVGCATATGQVRFPPRTVTTTPTWGIYANPAASGSIHTILDYFLDDPGHATAQARALSAGSTHCFELFDYGAAEDTVGHFPLDAYFTRVVSNCTGGTAIWLNVAPVGTDGLRHVPAGLEATAWDDPAMIAAYNGFVDHLFTITGNQLKLLSVGNEIDGYFGLHPSEIAAYATFLRAVRSHAHTLFGGQFQVATTWTYTGGYAQWADYAAVAAAIDVKAFTYYFFGITGTDDISTEFQRAALMANGPYIYQEIGFPSSPTFGLTLADQNNIITYAQALLNAFAAQRQLIGATWFQLSDYNEDVLTNAGYTTPLLQYFATGGLRDTANAAKLSFTTLCTAFGGTNCTDAVTPTAPATPNTPSPATSATAVSITPTLTFACSGETSTTIDFGTNTPPSNIVSGHSLGALTTYTPASLTASTQYYWKVHCTNATGTTDGPIWTFTTYSASAPAAPNTPSPANSATGVSINPTLSFACAGETSTTIDFGTDSPPTNIKSNFSLGALTAFTPATLINSTTYHWKVHCTNATGTTNGSEWTFTTAAPTVHISPFSGPACADPADDSVTGRNPATISCAQMHILHAEYADYQAHPTQGGPTTPGGKWMERIVHACADSSDVFSCAILYQMSGNATYATLAANWLARNTGDPILQDWQWACLGWASGTSPCDPGGHCVAAVSVCGLNIVTFASPDYEMEYDFLYSGWDTATQDRAAAYLNDVWTDYALHTDHGIHDTDSGLLGPYSGFMTWYELTKDSNPQVVTDYNGYLCPASDGCVPGVSGLGGLDANQVPRDRTTMRNAIYDLVTRFAGGGEWVVSPEYNVDDLKTMVAGRNAITNIMHARGDATDHFPEITAWLADGVLWPVYDTTPDFHETVGWGDTANFRQIMVPRTMSIAMGVLLGGDPSNANAPYGQDWLLDLADSTSYTDSHPLNATGVAQMEARGLVWYPNTTVARGDRTTLPKGRYESGGGWTYYQDGWGTNDSLFTAQFPHFRFTNPDIGHWEYTDHAPLNFGCIQLYRQGGWALTYPQNYGAFADSPSGCNSWFLYGDGSDSRPAAEYKQTVAHEIGTSPDYAYQAGTNGGEVGIEDQQAAGSYVHEITRSVVYLPSSDKQSDTIVTFDRFNNDDHNGQLPRRGIVFHMPVSPTVETATRLTWTAANGDHAQLDSLLPTTITRTVYDETTLGYGPVGSEAKFHVLISNSGTEPQFDTFLNVFTADDSIVHSAGVIRSGDGAEGVMIHRASLNDVALFFNGRVAGTQTPQPSVDNSAAAHWNETVQDVLDHVHYFRTGYSVTFSTTTTTTNVLLFDLDPALTWTKSVDGAGASALTVSAQGVAKFTISGAAGHTVVIGGGTTEQQIQPLGTYALASNLSIGATTSVTGSYTASGTNTYLAVGGWIANTADHTAGCTANGVAMTLIGKQQVNSDIWEYAYGLAAPTAGTHPLACSFTGNESADFVGQVYNGVKQVNTPDHVTLTLGSSPTGENFSFSNQGTVKNVWHVGVVRTSVLPAGEYKNTRTIRRATYPTGGVSMFDSGGPVSTIRNFTMTTLQGGGFNSQYGAIMFSLAPAP